MSRKIQILSLSLAGVCGLMVSKASGQLLAGNVWPNPGLTTHAPAGVDQVYSYYNGTFSSGGSYVPNATGDSNPRPDGWHRGGGDFGTMNVSGPSLTFYNPSEGTQLSAPPSGAALEINDSDPNNYGEWFSDFNALPAASVNGAVPITLQFFWEYTNLASTQRSPQDNFRVSVDFADSVGNDIMTAPNTIGNSVDDLLNAPGSPDLTSFTQVDETITPPAGAESMRITIDSGGSSQATGQIWVDNISVASASVPEPTSLAVIGAGAMCLATRRRRRA